MLLVFSWCLYFYLFFTSPLTSANDYKYNNCTNLKCQLLNETDMLWYTWDDGTSYYFKEDTNKNVNVNNTIKCNLEKHNVTLGKCK